MVFPNALNASTVLPTGTRMTHKTRHGVVDIVFPGWGIDLDKLRPLLQRLLAEPMAIKVKGKSLAVEVEVPVVEPNDTFRRSRGRFEGSYPRRPAAPGLVRREPRGAWKVSALQLSEGLED